MKDLIVGRIKKVDGPRRIEVEVMQVVRKYNDDYESIERVYVRVLKTNMMGALETVNPHLFLNPDRSGSGIMCLVRGRQENGCVEADVYILERSIYEEVEEAI